MSIFPSIDKQKISLLSEISDSQVELFRLISTVNEFHETFLSIISSNKEVYEKFDNNRKKHYFAIPLRDLSPDKTKLNESVANASLGDNTAQNKKYFITIHDKFGYDFTSEYLHVYNGKIDGESMKIDSQTILLRALTCIAEDIDEDKKMANISPLNSNEITLKDQNNVEDMKNNILRDKYLEQMSERLFDSFCDSMRALNRKIKLKMSDHFSNLYPLNDELETMKYNAQIFIGRCEDQLHVLKIWFKVTIYLNISSQIYPTVDSSTDVSADKQKDSLNISVSNMSYEICCYQCVELDLKTYTPVIISPDSDMTTYLLMKGYFSLSPSENNLSGKSPQESIQSSPRSQYSDSEYGNSPAKSQHRKSINSPRIKNSSSQKIERSPNIEVLGWGNNEHNSIGLAEDHIPYPKPIPLPIPAFLDPIKMFAFGPNHSLMLTHSGLLFACGNNTEGALGQGDLISRLTFTSVQWTQETMNDIKYLNKSSPFIVKIAAGGGLIGSHSMAIDRDGNLYGWGVPQAVGVSTLKPVLHPTKVSFPESKYLIEDSQSNDRVKILDVSCGNCFTLAVTSQGNVYSWGMWSYGRLGLGPIPTQETAVSRRFNKTAAKYQLQPRQILRLRKAVKVSCGDSHALCLMSNGEAYSWGRNSHGQVGVGVSSSGFLKDILSPRRISFCHNIDFDAKNISSLRYQSTKITHICAGMYHSLAIDDNHNIWSWGGRGGSCLGHGDNANIQRQWSAYDDYFNFGSNIMIPHEMMPWCQSWSSPRGIETFKNMDTSILSMTAGENFSMFLTRGGEVYFTGDNPYMLSDSKQDVDSIQSDFNVSRQAMQTNNENNTSDKNTDKDSSKKETNNSRGSSKSIPTRLFMKGSNIVDDISSLKKCVLLAAGSSRVMAIFDGENIAQSLMQGIYRSLLTGKSVDDVANDPDSIYSTYPDNNSSSIYSSSSLYRKLFPTNENISDSSNQRLVFNDDEYDDYEAMVTSHANADCVIIATGKVLPAHRAILAARSPVLRDMILLETKFSAFDSNTIDSSILQLFLPELLGDVAAGLLYFIYTDCLPPNIIRSGAAVNSLVQASKKLKIERLQNICKCLTKANTSLELYRLGMTEDDDMIGNFNVERPALTLTKNLNNLVGDPQFADVMFLVEGKSIYAHRIILEYRSDYFRAMFRSGMSESNSGNRVNARSKKVLEIVVPDTYIGMMRALIFMYTDSLPSANLEIMLEDLIMADRYGVSGMKRFCESQIHPTPDSWMDILIVADAINSSYLMHTIKIYLREHVDLLQPILSLTSEEANPSNQQLLDLKDRFSDVFIEIFDMCKSIERKNPSTILRDRVLAANKSRDSTKIKPTIPLVLLPIVLCAIVGYNYLASVITLGWIVPAINVTFTFGIIIWGIYTMDFQ